MNYESWRISYQSSEQAARAAYAENQRLAAALEAAREDAWVSVIERLPPDGEVVEVYGPDVGDGPLFDFDGVEDGRWVEHDNRREHFLMVGGSAAAGPDVSCTGPAEDAPYTHWRPLRAPAIDQTEAGK